MIIPQIPKSPTSTPSNDKNDKKKKKKRNATEPVDSWGDSTEDWNGWGETELDPVYHFACYFYLVLFSFFLSGEPSYDHKTTKKEEDEE